MSDALLHIRDRLAEIERLTQALGKERDELLVAERVIARLGASASMTTNGEAISGGASAVNGTVHASAGFNGGGSFRTATTVISGVTITAVTPPITQRALIIATLKAAADPWVQSSGTLHEQIKTIHGKEIPKGSFQPLLWQLDRDKVIVRKDSKIALAERVKGGH